MRFTREQEEKLADMTIFEREVLFECAKIPKGETRTYAQVAAAIGRPKAVRAVGSALAKNPLAPLVPCHRVVRSDGKIGNYSGKGGSATKRRLLAAELKA